LKGRIRGWPESGLYQNFYQQEKTMELKAISGGVWPALVVGGLCLGVSVAQADNEVKAVADIVSCSEARISGRAVLEEEPSQEGVKVVEIEIIVKGLPDGKHAVHIHETGACRPCEAAKGHFDPGPNGNTNPDGNHPFHLGDLVNIESKDGTAKLEAETTRITLSPGPLSIFDRDGSAFIIHVDPDTYCPEGVEKGCAGGARAACGVIRLTSH
jgi:Cu-Zn family superoxide dismutase